MRTTETVFPDTVRRGDQAKFHGGHRNWGEVLFSTGCGVEDSKLFVDIGARCQFSWDRAEHNSVWISGLKESGKWQGQNGTGRIMKSATLKGLIFNPQGKEDQGVYLIKKVAWSDLYPRKIPVVLCEEHFVAGQIWPLSWGTATYKLEDSSKLFYLSEHQHPHL